MLKDDGTYRSISQMMGHEPAAFDRPQICFSKKKAKRAADELQCPFPERDSDYDMPGYQHITAQLSR